MSKVTGWLKCKNGGTKKRPITGTNWRSHFVQEWSLWLRTSEMCCQVKTWKTKILFIEKFILRVSHSLSVSQLPSACEENVSRTYRLLWEMGSWENSLLPTVVQRERKQTAWVTHLGDVLLTVQHLWLELSNKGKNGQAPPFPPESRWARPYHPQRCSPWEVSSSPVPNLIRLWGYL